MDKFEVTRNGNSNEFSVVLSQGGDSIRCMITVGDGSDQEKRRAALCKAKALAKALDTAIEDS
ncbi:MAG: hypothetical protein KGZ73_02060 [Rhizobiales bacterium]|jgi:hypothetical protein|nr:hypothetical protein [Hyphomicrobiales bacterium]